MRIYCGTDIIEIERIKQCIEEKNTGKMFIERVFTINEIQYCESKKNQKYQHYAARFAAKEAAFKALSEQIEDKFAITWKDIEIINNKQGKPKINLTNIETTNLVNIDLSISHCKEYAVANVTILTQ